MNLSPEIVMKSLVPALDFNFNCKIFIPGIQKKIQFNQNFFSLLVKMILPQLEEILFLNY
jgi:hypothetical protein